MTIESPTTGVYVPYEYASVRMPKGKETLYRDTYRNFGWESDERGQSKPGSAIAQVEFKRNRDIRNRDEVVSLQRAADTALQNITVLERARTSAASIVAYIIGIIGAAFLAVSVFAVQSNVDVTGFIHDLQGLPSVIAGGIGILLWLAAPAAYHLIRIVRTGRVKPRIDREYDVLYKVCEQASLRLRRVA